MMKKMLSGLSAALLALPAAWAASSSVPPATEDLSQGAIDYNISVVKEAERQIEDSARARMAAEAQAKAEAEAAKAKADAKAKAERAKADRVRAEANAAAQKRRARPCIRKI